MEDKYIAKIKQQYGRNKIGKVYFYIKKKELNCREIVKLTEIPYRTIIKIKTIITKE